MRRLFAVIALALVPLTACSVEVTHKVSREDVESEISKLLEAQVGAAPEKIECPDSLEAEVGKKMQCVLEHQGTRLPVDVEVTKVDGKDVKFYAEVGTEPLE